MGDELSVKQFKEGLFWPQPKNTRLSDNDQERRPITIELNLNAVTLCDEEESLPPVHHLLTLYKLF